MTKREWLKKSSIAVMLSTSLLMFAEGGQAYAATSQQITKDVVAQAYDLLGKPYKKHGNDPSGFDSAGYVTYVLHQQGVHVKDSISALKKAGTSVDKDKLQPGDVVFFKSSSSYVGVFVGNDKFLYASKGQGKVIEQSFSKVEDDFKGARRIVKTSPAPAPAPKPAPAPAPKPTPAPAPAPDNQVKPKPDQNAQVSNDIGAKIIKAGEKYLGTPYKYASDRDTKTTMDCSEFTMWAFKEGAGIDLSRGGARTQFKKGTPIKRSELKVGDLVFFSTGKTMKYPADSINRIGHVGIYAGNNKVLHTYGKGGVKYSSMDKGWWNDHYVTAARYF